MTVQEFLNSVMDLLNFCAVYYVIQLVRCVLISLAVFAFVFTLRKTVLKNRVFLKGALWSLFIPVLFMGRMQFFYENKIGVILFTLWTGICIDHIWICWLYLCVVLLYIFCLHHRRKELKTMVAGMEKRKVDGTVFCVTKTPVTPFTIGVFRPKIVMPEVILKEYSEEEFQTILLHEKTHIRLGHLLFYFLWDILRALLWLNPFLAMGTKYFREDMEEICDYVTIKRSEGKAYAYGQLLLKSMRVLQAENENFNMYATFSGDKGYQGIRQRVIRIAGYKPYKGITAAGTLAAAMLCVVTAFLLIQNVSYARYTKDESMAIYGFHDTDVTFYNDSSILNQMISYDDNYVYVDKGAFENFLCKNNADGDIYILFGNIMKMPGFGGGGSSCHYEFGSKEQVVKIPYENPMRDWRVKLLTML